MVRTKLRDFLTTEQQDGVRSAYRFMVRGNEGGEYRISVRTATGNILVMRSRWFLVGTRLCCHPVHHPPYLDEQEFLTECLITQKLMIEHDEAYFMSIAHVYL